GYSVRERDGQGGLVVRGPEQIAFDRPGAGEVLDFLHELSGTGSGRPGKDYAGREVSEAEVLFALGEPSEWQADQERVARRMSAKPKVLRLDEQDRTAVAGGMPGYVYHGLRRGAAKVVQSAAFMYPGLRREGRLQE